MMKSRDLDSEGGFDVIYDAATDSLNLVPTLPRASSSDANVVDKHPYARFFSTVAAGTGGAVLSAAIGSELLNVMTGKTYDTRAIVEASSVGGAALFTLYGVTFFCIQAALNPKINAWTVLGLSTGLLALSGILGAVIQGEDSADLFEFATAPALGAAVVGGVCTLGLKVFA